MNLSNNNKHSNNAGQPAPECEYVSDGFELTDFGNAKRFVSQHGENVRYVRSRKTWYVWNGKFWAPDADEVERRAKDTLQSLADEAANCRDEFRQKELRKHARASQNLTRFKAMIEFAKSEPGVSISADEFDDNPYLLNSANGTINLLTGELCEHKREDMITKMIPTAYDPNASSLLWSLFLRRIFGDKEELIDYVQKIVGLSLTGDATERVIFVLYGKGANGKSTFLTTLQNLLGDYAKQTPSDTLMVKPGNSIPNDIARLRGARLVCASEAERGRKFAEALIKALTGGDAIVARMLFHEFEEFRPEFKLMIAVNHLPEISGSDIAMWDRVRLIPFNVRIPENERDPLLAYKLSFEMTGILAWAVEGYLKYRKEGLNPPEAVQAATAEYRNENDHVGRFIAECCVVDTAVSVESTQLYDDFERWRIEGGEAYLSRKQFASELRERGFINYRQSGGRHAWRGIRLLTDAELSEPSERIFTTSSAIKAEEDKEYNKVHYGSLSSDCDECAASEPFVPEPLLNDEPDVEDAPCNDDEDYERSEDNFEDW
ncbi:MAG: phage/plasmid primase, P4 family [Armatimonadetes bacterium]|nr:phage/plasmid primase, P4 family [Armatimonadota bacterium]